MVKMFAAMGFGALIASLGQGLPVQLSNPVKSIDWSARFGVEISTARGTVIDTSGRFNQRRL